MGNPTHIDTTVQWASMRQIHCAIEHLHKGDFECAITLAGAGEGILPETDGPHFRQKVIAFSKEIPAIDGGAKGANDFFNWCKHGSLVKGGQRYETAKISQFEVLVAIYRAMTKFQAVYEVQTPQMLSFKNWLKENLPTL
jgi:hypothetical protein